MVGSEHFIFKETLNGMKRIKFPLVQSMTFLHMAEVFIGFAREEVLATAWVFTLEDHLEFLPVNVVFEPGYGGIKMVTTSADQHRWLGVLVGLKIEIFRSKKTRFLGREERDF